MMDELVSHVSFCSPPSPPSFFSNSGPSSVLEMMSCGVPEQWLVGSDDMVDQDDDIKPLRDDTEWAGVLGSHSVAGSGQPAVAATVTEPVVRKRGRKPGVRLGPGISHVEAERQRREKLNRRFCDLRAAVPTVSRMDKASLLADAAAYITELRGRVEQLEAEARKQAAAASKNGTGRSGLEEKLEVRMVGREAAALRLTTTAARHAPAHLMGALRSLDLVVQHACMSRVVGDATVQDAVVIVPAALQDGGCLRAALLHVLEQDDGH